MRRERVGRRNSVGRLKRMPDVSPKRWRRRALVRARPAVFGACMPSAPTSRVPACLGSTDWSADALQAAQEEARTQRPVQVDQWWRNFGDPVLEKLVEEAQRLNPGVRTAGLRILEARAELGIAGSGLYPQLQQLSGNGLWVGTEQSDGPDRDFWTGSAGLDVDLGAGLLGQVPSRHRGGGCRATSRASPSTTISRCSSRREAASFYASIRTIELRLRIAHENAALQKRSLEITERLFRSGNESELDLQQARTLYLSTLATIPELEASLLSDPERAGDPARHDRRARCRRWTPGASASPTQTSGSSPSCRPTCCAGGRTCARPSCSWPRSRPASG